MREGGVHGPGELLEQHHRLARGGAGGFDRAAGDVDDGGAEAGLADEVHEGAPRLGIALRPSEHVGLRRLDQLDQRIPRPLVRFAGRAQDLGDAQHLRRGQPVEGVADRQRGRDREGGESGGEPTGGHGSLHRGSSFVLREPHPILTACWSFRAASGFRGLRA